MDYDPIPSGPTASASESTEEGTFFLRIRRILLWVIPVAAALTLGVLGGITVAAAIRMPRVDQLGDYQPGLITELYDRNGRVFATYALERRVMLEEGEVPDLLKNAVAAAEDVRFYQHGGIDAWSVARAAVTDVAEGRKAQGASTITMQLARMLFLTPDKSWSRKIEEALLAVELEKSYSKQQILTFYCNMVPVGHGNYGMEAGARYYFNKSVDELNLAEAAMLAGIPQRPSELSPYRKPEAMLRRRNSVLRRMLEAGLISDAEHAQAAAQPLLVVQRRPKVRTAPYFAEEIRRYLESAYGETALYKGGLRLETTLDLEIQRAAEEALRQGLIRLDHEKGWRGPSLHLDSEELEGQELPSWSGQTLVPGGWVEGIVLDSGRHEAKVKIGEDLYTLGSAGIEWTQRSQPRSLLRRGDVAWFRLEIPEGGDGEAVLFLEQEPELEGSLVVLESATGAVRALVGGWDFQRNQFNRVTQARRQVGSAFKPFVYGAALEMGYTPADTLFDAPVVFEGQDNLPTYSPRNYYRKYYGIMTLRRALENSINVTSVKLLDLIGVDQAIDFARRCGIQSDLPPYPSLALGTADLVPLEVAAAYAAIANQGIYVEPYFIERISTPVGRTLEEHMPQAHKAMEPAIAYVLTHILEGVVDRGTAWSAAQLDLDLAGKTGTTDQYTDAWFVGFNPRYTVLTWVGYDLKKTIGRRATGAAAALPIWKDVITHGLENGWLSKENRFVPPPGVTRTAIEYFTGTVPAAGAERIIEEAFVAGTEPAQDYDPRWAEVLELPWYQQRAFYGIPKEGERMPEDVEDWTLVKEAWEGKEIAQESGPSEG